MSSSVYPLSDQIKPNTIHCIQVSVPLLLALNHFLSPVSANLSFFLEVAKYLISHYANRVVVIHSLSGIWRVLLVAVCSTSISAAAKRLNHQEKWSS